MSSILNKLTTILASLFLVFLFVLITNGYTTSNQKSPEWRYEVRGYVNYKGQKHEAIWLTDSIEIGDNYLQYKNSDGTKVVIPEPFILIDHKYDNKQINK